MKKTLRVRCWIDIDGTKFFGPGRAELLTLIGETGSVSKAARAMGMSYKKAWDMVAEMNEYGRKPYVRLQKGGTRGGGAEVTETGMALLKEYQQLTKKLDLVAARQIKLLRLV